jgi:CHAD domain-containing protein
MAFRLKLDEPIEKGFRRIAAEQVQRARKEITAKQDPTREIHEARKCMKRIRALLRLAREGLGEAVFRTENARFRAIAAAMAPARDESVLHQTLVKFAAASDNVAAPVFERLRAALKSPQPGGNTAAAAASLDEVPALLDRAVRQVRKLSIAPDTFETLERGLVRNYRRALKCLELAYADGSDESFHDWRKCVQTHWRHMALLSRASPPLFEAHIAAARELSQILGDDHDLAMLKARVASLDPEDFSARDRETIVKLIVAEQRALRQAARLRGQMIFAERPKAHGRRIAGLWSGAVALARLAREADEAKPSKCVQLSASVPART